ncbi:hypothetical protein BVER_01835 [Candidatus Burkholderia verschuerenii]|uniref:Uncharacterized protein n=1 Tax=Candidatus Burkholderia verschuerenii TaxID=242163 RepID=A0A0L0MI33_9BURK|nr:hypothetical protein [Candidatus Burkholderia verschuerenii]KND62352.1 hypothetical protein BVER_01835 [Candidatus Burkholderia verschuerenii]
MELLLWIVVPVGIVGFLIAGFRQSSGRKARMEARILDLGRKGFRATHVLKRGGDSVLFDDERREVAFVTWDSTHRFSYGDVRTRTWHWLDKNGTKINNRISIAIANPQTPLFDVHMFGARDAEQWMAKINAILEGEPG